MSNTLVSARVSQTKKEAAVGVLASLGATTSDLINTALDYVLAEKRLPTTASKDTPTKDDFASFVNASSLVIDWGSDAQDGDYKALIAQGRAADYESLA